ncbi:DUF6247 family protein [Nonomuraea sp. NPDC050328]|uniref:DUF6247 family protein n=1 Tax=Nonomuraea sp. NPDC050328 TaxID=3364361 RepID=UPI0037B20559
MILSRLTDPAQRSAFLGDYEGALKLAVDPSRYALLEQVLHEWDLRSRAYQRPGYWQAVADAGRAEQPQTSLDDLVPGWRDAAGRR